MISYPEASIDLLMLSLLDCSPPYSLFSEEGCKTKEKLEFYLVLWKKETPGLEIVTQGSQIRQIWRIYTQIVHMTPQIFSNKQGATSTPGIFGNKHSFVLTFFATNTIYVNCKRCKP